MLSVAPGIIRTTGTDQYPPELVEAVVSRLHRTSRQNAGVFGEVIFACVLGLAIFWLYYQVYIHGPASILPAEWANPKN